MLEDEDVVMLPPVDLGTVSSSLMSDVVFACGAEHEDNPFVYSYRVIILFMACLGNRDFLCIFFLDVFS